MATPKRAPGRPKILKVDPELILDESRSSNDEASDMETLFREINHAYQVKVYRNEPEWCCGYLGYFYKGAKKGLTMEEIKNRFGGRQFQLTVYHPSKGGILSSRTVVIDDVPRREGLILNRDLTTQSPVQHPATTEQPETGTGPIDQILNMGLPTKLQNEIIGYLTGRPEYSHSMQQHPQQGQSPFEMAVMKQILDMMQAQTNAQINVMRQQYDMHSTMMRDKRDFEERERPKSPLNDVNDMIKMIQAFNTVQTEMRGHGGAEQSIGSQLIEQLVPLADNVFSEYMASKRLSMQNQFQTTATAVAPSPPELQSRRPEAGQLPGERDPITQAREMARMYRSLPPEEQNSVMQTFLGVMNDDENVAEVENVPESGILVDDEDREILYGNNSKTGYLPDVVDAGTAQNDHPTDWPGNQGRIPFSADPSPGGESDIDDAAQKLPGSGSGDL